MKLLPLRDRTGEGSVLRANNDDYAFLNNNNLFLKIPFVLRRKGDFALQMTVKNKFRVNMSAYGTNIFESSIENYFVLCYNQKH